MECRKRSLDEPVVETTNKRPKYHWYFRLESESSCTSQEDTESVHSIQNRETDVARDTSDTDTKSVCSDRTDLQVELEYEVASPFESDNPLDDSANSSGTDDALAAVGAITAVICDSSYEAWATDEDDSDSSALEDNSFRRNDFWICAQCKSRNDNPRFQFCDRCFQVRKSFFPPRPRKYKKPKTKRENPPVKLESLQSCLNGLSQDSGVGSSQEFASLQLDKIVVPSHLTSSGNGSDSKKIASVTSRKRHCSESSLSECEENKRFKIDGKEIGVPDLTRVDNLATVKNKEETSKESRDTVDVKNEQVFNKETINQNSISSVENNCVSIPETKELCIICNVNPKNSIFLHGNIAHMCSCYKCAMRTWGTNKRCPVCNCKVRNVVKVFTI